MISNLNILALDTAFGEISAALHCDRGSFYAASDSQHGKTRSTQIVPLLDELLGQAGLNWNQLQLLALGAGPGAFTGLRIAAATLAGINSGLKLPILHISSLAVTAAQVESGDDPIWLLEDARAGELFAGCYRSGEAVEHDCCMRWDDLLQMSPGCFAAHNEPPVSLEGWQRLPLTIARSEALLATVIASGKCVDPATLPDYPDPVYLQRSQAEKNIYG